MKNNLPMQCYWCGKTLAKDANEREHVPALGFFPKGYRDKLITVRSCEEHNSKFSKLDERFQLYVKAISKSQIAIDDFKDKTVRALNREKSRGFVKDLSNNSFYTEIEGEQRLIMKIDVDHTQKFIEKVVRAIYFYHNEVSAPENAMVQGLSPSITNEDYDTQKLFDYLLDEIKSEDFSEGDYNNPDIFQYRYLTLPSENYFFVVFVFYKSVEFVGWVIPSPAANKSAE